MTTNFYNTSNEQGMAAKRPRRSRGVQLTAIGYDRFYQAKQAAEATEKKGDRFTLEELNERTGLALGTLTRLLNRDGVVDKRTLTIAFRAFDLELQAEDYVKPLPLAAAEASRPVPGVTEPSNKGRHDWGSAVDVSRFHHRQTELATLEQWLQTERCRLVALLGLGGIGKTYLAVKAGQQLQSRFERVLWRSLRSAPTLTALLEDILGFLTGRPAPNPAVDQLVTALQTERCLVILDGWESVMQPDQQAGAWLPGYAGYGELLRQLGTATHQSCLLLTSREQPAELAALANRAAVRSLMLYGCPDVARAILQACPLQGTPQQFNQLCEQYGGVPLALTLIAPLIQELFGGDVAQFLAQQSWLPNNLRDLLASQFERLSEPERAIADWLAIHQEGTPLTELECDLVPTLPRRQLLDSLESLRRRSLVEVLPGGGFTLQSVIRAYVSDRWVDAAYDVLMRSPASLQRQQTCLHTHALLQAQASEPVRQAQLSQFVQPLLQRLLEKSSPRQLVARLRLLLALPGAENTYWAGNLLNLLIQLQADLRGGSFDALTLWQVDFRGVNLVQTSFCQADLAHCRFSHPFGPVYALVFGHDGTLMSGHGDGELRCWQWDGRLCQQFQLATPISTLGLSPKGTRLAVGTFDGAVQLYERADDTSNWVPGRSRQLHEDWIHGLAFLSEGSKGDRLASGSSDGRLKIWNFCTETVQHCFEEGPITALSVSRDGWLVSCDETGGLQLWLIDSQTEPWRFRQNAALVGIAISPDGTLVASADTQQLQIWQRQGSQLQPLWQTPLTSPWSLAFSPDSQTLAVVDGATIQLFDAVTSLPLHTLSGHAGQVWSLAFDPTGTLLASGSDHQICLWQVSSGDIWRTWKTAVPSESPILAATFSPDGRWLASGNGQGEVRLWNCETQQCVGMGANQQDAVRAIALAPQAALIASGSDRGTVRLWNPATRSDTVILNHPQAVTALAIRAGGHQLASGSADGTLRLWNLQQNRLEASLTGHEGRVLAIAFSPDGQWLATSSTDYAIRLWRLDQTMPQIVLKGHQGWVWSVAFSPDGQWLASGADDRTVKLWDWQRQTCRRTLPGHQKLVKAIAFWPDSDTNRLRLVSASLDQTLKIWSRDADQPLDTVAAQTDLLWTIQPVDQQLMIAGTHGNTLQLWDISLKSPKAVFQPQSWYQDMDITNARGLSPATIQSLVQLGAIAETSL